MNNKRRIIILALLGIAIIGTLMLKDRGDIQQDIVADGKLPVLLDMTTET